ncbi:hypothetical protein [Streptacidiphilus fuscans]|uniref:Heparin binding hemagglutinin HbhA n=1 Tax=Streptacidiphilus fuscans TaxID=2789292 RepID=A0A931FHD8_9ACTN|nr:hypothetical protein [Streptacidiphilus fuscans]MBF9072275.1 hypothetical protein [Streptacidiphilus fuscans]
MPITDDLRKTLSDPTPLYALAGAGDLAVEKLRTVPEKAAALAADRQAAQEKATARLTEAQARLVEAQAKVTETVQSLPTDIKSLQERAQSLALQSVGRAAELAVKAREVYDELAVRGKVVVDRQFKDGADDADPQPVTAKAERSNGNATSKADVFAAGLDDVEADADAEVVDIVEVVEVVEIVDEPAPAKDTSAKEAVAPKPARKSTPRKPRTTS